MIFGLLAKTTIPKVTNGKENTVLKQQNNALSDPSLLLEKQGFTVQTGSSGGDEMVGVAAGNNIKNTVFPS